MGNRASPLIPCPTTWSSPERQLLTGKPDTGQTTGFPVSFGPRRRRPARGKRNGMPFYA